ncbi:MAG: FKBP-type peptidyl-prolyl cis-trans isomerase [Verrucomicrobiota bacterium]
MKSVLTAVLITGLFALQTRAEEKKAPEPVKAPQAKTDKNSVSYAIGMNIGNSIKQQSIDVDVDTLAKAIKDVLSGSPTRFTEDEARQTMMAMQNDLRAKREEERKQQGEKNKKEGETFLAENAKKPGVKIHPVKLNEQTYKLQYKVITEGKGAIPKATDRVSAQYRGTFIDGKEFDNSYKRGQPFEAAVTGEVIKGWTEALLLMPVGSKWELYIPSELAYGEQGRGSITPNAVLIFELELVGIKPPPAESSQAVSGEIIKVPSADELKKGAKIEVIRPGQTNELKPK